MSADAWFRFFVVLAILYLAVRLALALWRGRWRDGGELYLRGQGPPGYWREVAIDLLVLVILVLGLLLIPPPGEADPGPPYGALAILAVFTPQIVRALATGRIPFGNAGLGYWRADRPGAYWAIVLAGTALCALALAILAARLP